MVKVNCVEAFASAVSVTDIFILKDSATSGVPEKVFVSASKFNHTGKVSPLLNTIHLWQCKMMFRYHLKY